MPQLDKYIFFNQIISLTLFFFLIYIYTRRTIIPKFSSILKFRIKLFNKIKEQTVFLENLHYSAKYFFSNKAISYIYEVSLNIVEIFNKYEIKTFGKIQKLELNIWNYIDSNNNIKKYIIKNKKEKIRL